MTKLKELEKRLRDEPDNLGLRVMVAGALHEAGRLDDATELYRSVAIAYREQGRPQQAIMVCRSVLEIAPDDASCKELLAALLAAQPAPRESPLPERLAPPPPGPAPAGAARLSPPPPAGTARLSPPRLPRPEAPQGQAVDLGGAEPARRSSGDVEPARRSSGDVTPLPLPLPYHDADPSSSPKLAGVGLTQSLQDELATYPEIAGIANAARQISASLIAASRRAGSATEAADDDLSGELDTRRLPRISAADLDKIAGPPPAVASDPVHGEPGDDDPTFPPATAARTARPDDDPPTAPLSAPPARPGEPRASLGDDEPSNATGVPGGGSVEDEKTSPRELPTRTRPPSIVQPTAATGPLASAFFAPLPPHNRAAVLQRFRRRMVPIGTTVIRRGEAGHGLVIVVRGRLELHADRSDGVQISLGAIGPGDYIGEVGLLARAPSAIQVVAAVDCELVVLAASEFYEVTAAFPVLWAELKSVAERRTREHEQRVRW
jgi:hypothetical protein